MSKITELIEKYEALYSGNGVETHTILHTIEDLKALKDSEGELLDKKPKAITYGQLLTLPWEKQFGHKYKPGYDNIDGDYNYFGTSKNGMRIISVNADYAGHTFVKIESDGGTRTVFNGHVRSFEELKFINSLVL